MNVERTTLAARGNSKLNQNQPTDGHFHFRSPLETGVKIVALLLVVEFRQLAGIEVRRDRVLHLNMSGVKGRAEQGMIGEAVVWETAERFVRRMNLRG